MKEMLYGVLIKGKGFLICLFGKGKMYWTGNILSCCYTGM